MQSKKQSIIESIVQTLVGLFISFIIQLIIYPSLNIRVIIGQNVIITSVFFIASIGRGYLIRRIFTKKEIRK